MKYTTTTTYKVELNSRIYEVEGLRARETDGGMSVNLSDAAKASHIVAAAVIGDHSQRTAETFRFARRSTIILPADFATLCGVDVAQVKAWEKGEEAAPAYVWTILGTLLASPDPYHLGQRLLHSNQPPTSMTL